MQCTMHRCAVFRSCNLVRASGSKVPSFVTSPRAMTIRRNCSSPSSASGMPAPVPNVTDPAHQLGTSLQTPPIRRRGTCTTCGLLLTSLCLRASAADPDQHAHARSCSIPHGIDTCARWQCCCLQQLAPCRFRQILWETSQDERHAYFFTLQRVTLCRRCSDHGYDLLPLHHHQTRGDRSCPPSLKGIELATAADSVLFLPLLFRGT